MRCVVPLFHAIPLFIPLFVCAGCGRMCVGVRMGWPDGVTCRGAQPEETEGWCSSRSALYTLDRELVLPCLDKHLSPAHFLPVIAPSVCALIHHSFVLLPKVTF